MASPVDAARTNTIISTAATPWTVALPASSAGDLLFMFCREGGTGNMQIPSGWTALYQLQLTGSDDTALIAYKYAVGGEGTSVSVDPGGSSKGAACTWRITGAVDPATQPPEISSVVNGSTTTDCDPPSMSPTGGSKDYLFLVLSCCDGETQNYTAPSGYSNLNSSNSGTGGAATTNCRIAGATKQVTGATEDPPNFTLSAAPGLQNQTWTIAIHPGAATPKGPPIFRPPQKRRAARFLTFR